MDFDNQKVYGDTSISDGLVFLDLMLMYTLMKDILLNPESDNLTHAALTLPILSIRPQKYNFWKSFQRFPAAFSFPGDLRSVDYLQIIQLTLGCILCNNH